MVFSNIVCFSKILKDILDYGPDGVCTGLYTSDRGLTEFGKITTF